MIAVSPESIRVSAQLIAKIGTAELTRPVSASRHAARRSSATVSWTPKRTRTIGTSVSAPSDIRIPTRSSGSSSRSPILMNMNEAPQSAASPSSIRRWARRTPSVTPYDRRVFHEAVRAIAIDWSGARERERFALQAAAAPPLRLLGGFTRAEAAELLFREADRDPDLAVGLDFAFSFPDWYVRELGVDARGLWELAAREGEGWLEEVRAPFWRRARDEALRGREALRRTDREVGGAPKSVFQLVGAGQVGTGTIRGLPLLDRLARAGFSVWPFEDARPPVAIEIYPRLFRHAHAAARPLAGGNPHAFDALISAEVMGRHLGEIR